MDITVGLAVVVALGIVSVHSAVLCHPGYYLHTPKTGSKLCRICVRDTYMPDDWHTHTHCYNCSRVLNHKLEKLVSECSSHHDAVIHCVDGYYRAAGRGRHDIGGCHRCTECTSPQHASVPCHKYSNTVCCPKDNFDYDRKTGKCIENCGAGEYFNKTLDKCTSCPPDTYMPLRKHRNRECKRCQLPESNTEYIIEKCTNTSPTKIGCLKDYYRIEQHDLFIHKGECRRCRECVSNPPDIFEGKSCSQYEDAVCCPNPGMLVLNGYCIDDITTPGPIADSEKFIPESSLHSEGTSQQTCGQGHYLNPNNGSCLRCPLGTHVEETNHSRTKCIKCCDNQGTPVSNGHEENKGALTTQILALTILLCVCILCVLNFIN